MATRMQQRRGTAAQWTAANPVLAAGEIGFETDTNQFKIGDGSSAWSTLPYFKNLEDLGGLDDFTLISREGVPNGVATLNSNGHIPISQLGSIIANAPATLDTLQELASYVTTLDGLISDHNIDTMSVHGIANTADLATTSQVSAAVTAHSEDTTSIHGIENTADLATQTFVNNAVTTHSNDTTSVHGIPNTALLETIEGAQDKADAAIAAAAADATTKANDAEAAAIAAAATDATAKVATETAARIAADSAHSALTENVHGIADTSVLVTQTDLTNAINGAEVDQAALAGDGIVWDSTNSEFDLDENYITTATQTELDLKAPLANPTFTGTVVLPTVTAGGSILPSTDNTYDLGSPTNMWKDLYVGPGSLYVNGQKVLQDESGNIVVSADINENLGLRTSGSGNIEFDPTGSGNIQVKGPLSIQAGSQITSSDGNAIVFGNAINTDTISSKTTDTDLSLSANGTGKVYVNDNAEVNGNLVVGGNLTVSGTTTTVNSETISLADNIIDLNSNFTSGNPTENAGIKIKRGDSSDVQIRWNESSDVWQFTNDGSTYNNIAGKTELDLKAPLASPTFTGTVTLPAEGIVFSDGTQSKAGVPSITTIASAIISSATLSAGEQDKFVPLAGAVTITLPATGYSTGQSIDFYQASGTGAQFASTNSVVGTPGLKFRTTYSVVTAMRISGGWLVFGDLSA